MPAAAGRMPAVPKTKEPDWTILHNKLPPTQRVGLVRPPPAAAGSSSHSSFCEEVFSAVVGIVNPGRRDRHDGHSRMRWTGQIFWLLAYDACAAPHLLPAFTFEMLFDDRPYGKSYPVTAAQLLPSLTGFLATIHFFKLAKNRDED